ncbi:hypothetical protein ACO1O0_008105 [Amphichorda felina]
MSTAVSSCSGPTQPALGTTGSTENNELPRAPSSPMTPTGPARNVTDDEANMSPDLSHDAIEDQDGAQAVLQPAMSAAASHLASPLTPAVEKAAAMEKMPGGGLFDVPLPEEDEGDDEELANPQVPSPPIASVQDSRGPTPMDSSVPQPQQQPAATSTRPATSLGQMPPRAPSPWQSAPRTMTVNKESSQTHRASLLRPSRGVLESAFGPTRNRSRSAGQDALKRLQKAFPSFSTPSHLLPSFPSSFFGSSGDKSSPRMAPSRPRPQSTILPSSPSPRSLPQARQPISQSPKPQAPARRSTSILSQHSTASSRPPTLRRVTSDESILYHSLSRASSLGDDDQFQDVREMVNMRLQAIKESLPEVPNFKMPSLPKISTSSFISINSFPSNDGLGPTATRAPAVDKVTPAAPRDGNTDLDSALEELTGDIVVMGGLRGSVLRFAEPPHQQCWAPVKLGFNMRKVNLEVGLEDEDEERMEESIIPSGMLSHIGPIDISRKLLKKLRNCENSRTGKLRVWDYGYDWRLSPHLLSRKLREFLETLPSNQPGTRPEARGAVVIAHSLGGMITRHAVNQRPDLFAGVLYAGVPQRCINILGPMRNGDVVLLNEKLLSAQVNFSMRTSFVFLPEDGFCFVDKNTREEYPVDFFDPQEWVKWHLSPCVQPPLPPYNRPAQTSTGSPSLSSLLPTSLRARAENRSEKWFGGASLDPATNSAAGLKDRTIAPQMYPGAADGQAPSATANGVPLPPSPTTSPSDPERKRYLEYLTRTLAATRQFRSELRHRSDHQAANAYPPLAVLYGKSTPTVYAAQVNGRDAIPCADAYDDLLFRAGDGVVLAKEAMLPEGYSVVRGGRVNTERGHITMLGDMEAVGRALRALVRGRRKGIGIGASEKS